MGVERVDYSSEQEYVRALQNEEEYYQRQQVEQQEPEAVPCHKCGDAMYEESYLPEKNICQNCQNQNNPPTQ